MWERRRDELKQQSFDRRGTLYYGGLGTRGRGVRHAHLRHTRFANPTGFVDSKMDSWIRSWICGFEVGFVDSKLDSWIRSWIPGFEVGFLDSKLDSWIRSLFDNYKKHFWIRKSLQGFQVGLLDLKFASTQHICILGLARNMEI